MSDRPSPAEWFWLLVCIASFAASFITWGNRHTVPPAGKAAVEPGRSIATPLVSMPAPAAPDDPGIRDPAATSPAQQPRADAAPRELPGDAGNSIKVLRCTLRGRVTYVDPASACPDGAVAKVTVLPR